MKKKVILIIICLFSVCLLTVTAIKTYSLFETRAQAAAASRLANWHIEVNNTAITSLTTANRTFNLGSINWTNQNHVTPGKGAPGSIGTIHIYIDPTDTEVSFMYTISIDLSSLNNSEFQIYQISENSGDTITRTDVNSYTGIAYLNDIQNDKEYDVEIQFIWNNSASNDDADYALGARANEDINIPITVELKQYIGETIEAYVEPIEEPEPEPTPEP